MEISSTKKSPLEKSHCHMQLFKSAIEKMSHIISERQTDDIKLVTRFLNS